MARAISVYEQDESDHSAPYRDLSRWGSDDWEPNIERVAAIGLDALLRWWERFRCYSHASTYGQSGCEFTGSVAYAVAGGGPPVVEPPREGESLDRARSRAYDLAVIEAIRRLGFRAAERARESVNL